MKATGDSPTSPPEHKSTLIEFPGISRNSVPQWRKELSERVREVQERRAREAAREAAEAERQRAQAATNPPQLELLPQTETPAMNPLVAAALKRIERAHQTPSVETSPSRSSLATAVAYAPEREENIMNKTVPPTIQLDFESEPPAAELIAQVEDLCNAATVSVAPVGVGSANVRQQAAETPARLSIVPPPSEPAAIKTELPQLPKRLIRDDPNDPALNYLDSIRRNVRVDDLAATSASVFRRGVSAVLDLIFCVLFTSPIAGAVHLTGNLHVQDTRVITLLAVSLVVVTFIYLTLTTALTGRTLGMRLLSLRVIDTKTGLIPTGGQSVARSFFYLFSLATVVGILFALVSREGYTAHDRFTRTAVVTT